MVIDQEILDFNANGSPDIDLLNSLESTQKVKIQNADFMDEKEDRPRKSMLRKPYKSHKNSINPIIKVDPSERSSTKHV